MKVYIIGKFILIYHNSNNIHFLNLFTDVENRNPDLYVEFYVKNIALERKAINDLLNDKWLNDNVRFHILF